MQDILNVGDVLEDLELSDDPADYKYVINKVGNGKLTLKWKRFKNLKVESMISIQNIDKNYMVMLKHSN